MKVAIRTDASIKIGSGHVMRCLTLAQALKEFGHQVFFICRKLEGNLISLIEKHGFSVYVLPLCNPPKASKENMLNSHDGNYADWLDCDASHDAEETLNCLNQNHPDWLCVDHYALNRSWEKTVKHGCRKLMVIDDQQNRSHECNLLLDFDSLEHDKKLYLVKASQVSSEDLLLGAKYFLIRKEFVRYQKVRVNRKVSRISVFFGGVDATNETLKALKALQNCFNYLKIDVIVGCSNPYKKEIECFCQGYDQLNFYSQIENMAEVLSWSDISFGAAGGALLERCALGLPSIVVAVADNQVRMGERLGQEGAICYLGHASQVSEEVILSTFKELSSNPVQIERLHKRSLGICDGFGTDRVVNKMMDLIK